MLRQKKEQSEKRAISSTQKMRNNLSLLGQHIDEIEQQLKDKAKKALESRIEELLKTVKVQEKAIAEKDKTINEISTSIKEQVKRAEERTNGLDKTHEEQKQAFAEISKIIDSKDNALKEKDKTIANFRLEINQLYKEMESQKQKNKTICKAQQETIELLNQKVYLLTDYIQKLEKSPREQSAAMPASLGFPNDLGQISVPRAPSTLPNRQIPSSQGYYHEDQPSPFGASPFAPTPFSLYQEYNPGIDDKGPPRPFGTSPLILSTPPQQYSKSQQRTSTPMGASQLGTFYPSPLTTQQPSLLPPISASGQVQTAFPTCSCSECLNPKNLSSSTSSSTTSSRNPSSPQPPAFFPSFSSEKGEEALLGQDGKEEEEEREKDFLNHLFHFKSN